MIDDQEYPFKFSDLSQMHRLFSSAQSAEKAGNADSRELRRLAQSIILNLGEALAPISSQKAYERFSKFRANDGFWMRWSITRALTKGEDDEDYYDGSRSHIEQAGARYLELDWFKSPAIDFAIVDALITSEACQFAEAIRRQPGNGFFDTILRAIALERASGDLERFALVYPLTRIAAFLVIYAAPIALLVFYGVRHGEPVWVLAGIAWAGWYVVRRIFRFGALLLRRILKQETN